MADQYIHLVSNAQPDLFPENRANDFTNTIVPIRLDPNEKWEVAGTELAVVNTIQTIPKDVSFTKKSTTIKTLKKEADFPWDLTFLDHDFPAGPLTHYCYPYSDRRFNTTGSTIWSSNIKAYSPRIHKVYDFLSKTDSQLELIMNKEAPLKDGRYDMPNTKSVKELYDKKLGESRFWWDLENSAIDEQKPALASGIHTPTPMLKHFFHYLLLSSKTTRQYLTFQPDPSWEDLVKEPKKPTKWYLNPITEMHHHTQGYERNMIQKVYEKTNHNGMLVVYSTPLQAILKFHENKAGHSYKKKPFMLISENLRVLAKADDDYFKQLLAEPEVETVLTDFDPSHFYYAVVPFHRVKMVTHHLDGPSLGELLQKIRPLCPGSTLSTQGTSVSLHLPLYGEVLGVSIRVRQGIKVNVSVDPALKMTGLKNRTVLDSSMFGINIGPGSVTRADHTTAELNLQDVKVVIIHNELIPPQYLPIYLPRTITNTHSKTMTIKQGVYEPEELVTALNKDRDGYLFATAKGTRERNTLHLRVTLDPGVTLELDHLLADILSVKSVITESETGSLPITLNAFSDLLLVYCPIVEESVIGGQREPLLRVVPFTSKKYMELQAREFYHLQYHTLTQFNLDRISIKLMTDYGEPFPLAQGRTMVTLHIRRKVVR